MKLDKLAIAAAAVFISAGASAAWESGVGGNAGNPIDGELVLTVWNADNNRSFTQDLGVTTRQFMTGEAADQTFGLSAEGLAFIGDGDIRFNVAGNSTQFVPGELDNYGFYFTGSQMPASDLAVTPLTARLSFFENYENVLATSTSGAGTVDDPVFFLEGANYAGAGNVWGEQLGGLTFAFNNVDTSGTDADPLNAWVVGLNATAQGGNVKMDAKIWTLDLATGELVYAVPVPAAAWLFGSALLGMAGAARRRKASKA